MTHTRVRVLTYRFMVTKYEIVCSIIKVRLDKVARHNALGSKVAVQSIDVGQERQLISNRHLLDKIGMLRERIRIHHGGAIVSTRLRHVLFCKDAGIAGKDVACKLWLLVLLPMLLLVVDVFLVQLQRRGRWRRRLELALVGNKAVGPQAARFGAGKEAHGAGVRGGGLINKGPRLIIGEKLAMQMVIARPRRCA